MTQPPHALAGLSRRTLLTAAPAAVIAARTGTAVAATVRQPSATAISAADSTPGAAADSIPDPLAVTGTWTRAADGGQIATAHAGQDALALSEQQIAANAKLAATITADRRQRRPALADRLPARSHRPHGPARAEPARTDRRPIPRRLRHLHRDPRRQLEHRQPGPGR